jgi:hypothetical protein
MKPHRESDFLGNRVMIDSRQFEFIKDKYGYYASWAIWAEEGNTLWSIYGISAKLTTTQGIYFRDLTGE